MVVAELIEFLRGRAGDAVVHLVVVGEDGRVHGGLLGEVEADAGNVILTASDLRLRRGPGGER